MINISITAADFTKRHPFVGTISASGTYPTTTDFTEWVVWADGKMLSYLQTGSTLPTDVGNILKNVADDLLIRKYKMEKGTTLPLDEGESKILPELTPQNKLDLDNLKGQSTAIEAPAFNFRTDRTTGGLNI